jgi:hypothetical protein
MNTDIQFLMGMTCALPAIIGLYRYKRMDEKFHPFVMMMILTVMVELISYLRYKVSLFQKIAPIAVNLYMLVNFGLFIYFIWKNKYLKKIPAQLFMLLSIFIAVYNQNYNNSLFRLWYYVIFFVSTVMLFVSVDILSRQMLAVKVKPAKNFWFWFSSISVLYNAYNMLIFGDLCFALFSAQVGEASAMIQHYVNMVCQILFAVAMIKAPALKEDN